jgi:F-box-like
MKHIDVLPDDVLLGIFDFYVIMNLPYERVETWKALVHVCRRWRSLVFQSPRRLNLQLYCTPKTPLREKLDIWPALPLFVRGCGGTIRSQADADNIIAALGQRSRICQIDLELVGRHLEEIFAAMQVPFPELTNLGLFMSHVGASRLVIPDSFSTSAILLVLFWHSISGIAQTPFVY